ncbi:MAG: glycosyltransferase family 61 protein [Acidobacteria bacterium]|nr:glycosyltransferase family 61 protein [Acidobacteriota bacterium]
MYEVSDLIYLPRYGVPICFGFVPEELIKFPEHLAFRLNQFTAELSSSRETSTLKPDQIEASPAEACVLGVMFSNVFQHWLEELLKVIILEKFGFDGVNVFPDWFPNFCRETLCLLGIPSSRILTINYPVRFKKGLFSTTVHHFNANQFPNVITQLRDRVFDVCPNERGRGPRIWAERGRDASGRDIINKEEVYRCIARYDFIPADFGAHTFAQQIGIDRATDVLAGPHGSAIAHCSLMRSDRKIVEIFSPFYINPSAIQLCQVMRHTYHQIVAANKQFDLYKHGTDIMVDIDHLELSLSVACRS